MSAASGSLPPRKKKKFFIFAVVFPVCMFVLTFAAYPLYSVFCRVTGYGGTPQVAEEGVAGAGAVAEQKAPATGVNLPHITVRHNAEVDKSLPWKFYPENPSDEIPLGETVTIYYVSENLSDKPVTGRSVYNVTPHRVGGYITKMDCFCFTEQTLQPGEVKRMPITFSIDPEIKEDRFLKEMNALTFSYRFYPVEQE